MRKLFTLPIVCAMILLPMGAIAGEKKLDTVKDKESYSLGVDIGKNLKAQGVEVDANHFAKGVSDGMSGGQTILTEKEMRSVLMAFQQRLQSEMTQKNQGLAKSNLTEGQKYLEENKKKANVKTLASGLQYVVLKEGSGKSPTSKDFVTTHYSGKLIDGTEFDSSYKRGEPAKFPVQGVIAGWTEALQLMKPGAKWELVVPSNLAYGEQGAGNIIGPNATLIFQVELISVETPKG